jgi:cytochrome c biogenesis protein CcmG/thiol:disulfide interchange protein DsbE
MNRNAKILSAIALGGLLVTVGLMFMVNQRRSGSAPGGVGVSSSGPVAAGEMAANFTLKDLKGDTVSLSSLRGKVVFLNIWATWCPPCREEMPSIQSLYEKFRGRKDFVVLAVSQDTEGFKAVAPYVEKNGIGFTVLLDPENKVGEEYDVSGIPETFIIDRDGRIVAHHLGPYDWSSGEMRSALEELIDAKAG